MNVWEYMKHKYLHIKQGIKTTEVVPLEVWDTDKVTFDIEIKDSTGNVGYTPENFAIVIIDDGYPTVILQGLDDKEKTLIVDVLDIAIHDPDETYRSLLEKSERSESMARQQLELTEEDLGYYSETLKILKEGK